MTSKKIGIVVIAIFVCFSFLVKAQDKVNKLPEHIHNVFIDYDNQLELKSINNLGQFKSLFHKNVVDTIKIPHDLYFTGLEHGFFAQSPLSINSLNEVFISDNPKYLTNIRNEFFQFGERVTLQSRFGYKLYQYRLNRMLYHTNYKANNKNEFAEIPYYISLLSYDDPNNSTVKRASIIKVSNQKIIYPPRFLPQSLTFGFQQGISTLNATSGVSDFNNSAFNLKANFLLTGKKFLSYYLQLGVGLYNDNFILELEDFSESFSSTDIDGTGYMKIANYTNLSQKYEFNLLEIPVAFKVQYYQYKNIFNVFGSVGLSYYTPLNYSVSNATDSKGMVEYYGNYTFGNNFNIDFKNLPEYGFDNYSITPSDNIGEICSNLSLNVELGLNLRINKQFSIESSIGLKYFLNDLELKDPADILSEKDGVTASYIQKQPVSLSMASFNVGLTYNLFPVRSPYYPVVDKRLLNLKGKKIKKGNLANEKIKLAPSSDFMMKNLKFVDYQYKRDNVSVSMRGKVIKKKNNYYLNVKVPKELNYIELVKPINYDLYTNETEALSDNMLLSVDMNNISTIKVSKITDLDIIVLFKFASSHPDNKFRLYESMSNRINSICSESSGNDKVLFANRSVRIVKPNEDCKNISSFLIEIQDQLDITDKVLISDYIAELKNNEIITKRRKINLHFVYLYKDMVFNTFEKSEDFLQLYPAASNIVSKFEKEIFGTQFNNIKVHLWSNFTPTEKDLLNNYRTINQINWEYNIY